MSAKNPTADDSGKSGGGILGTIEKIGNKVPHPVMMFLYLIIGVIVLSTIMSLLGVSVTEEIAVPVPVDSIVNLYEDSAVPGYINPTSPYDEQFEIRTETIGIRSLLSIEGIRFIFTSFVPNFSSFAVVGITFIALMGAGVSEEAGLMNAMIRKLVKVAPAGLLTFFIVFVGVLSSVASDAGYLILIPLAAVAFASVKKHPLVGLSAAFAGVACIFTVNIIPTPIDAMLTEITNESIALAGGQPITIGSNLFFGIGSSIVLAAVAAVVASRVIAPRLGEYKPEAGAGTGDASADTKQEISPELEARALRAAGLAVLGVAAVVLLLTVPPGAPLRRPDGQIEGNSPLMDSLLFIITLFFLIAGIAYGKVAGTIKGSGDVIKAVTKTFAGLAGLVFMLLMISQFIALFNYSNLPRYIAVVLAGILEQANIGALPLLIVMILVIVLLDFIMPGSVPKWAIFAPIFVPLFIRLGVAPESVLAAYRIGDSPVNAITPLMVYLPFILTIVQRYDKKAGIGTVISLMIPYVIAILIVWILLFIVWFLLNIPLGPGYFPQIT